jgi:GTP diphosphokinase / guanosine-3',5'-bis(diphosphate) 3'-diphosphatase
MRPTPPLPPKRATGTDLFVNEARLQRAIAGYLNAEDVARVETVLNYVRSLGAERERTIAPAGSDGAKAPGRTHARWDPAYVVSVALALADTVHVDAVSLGAVLTYQAVELGLVTPADVRARFPGQFGEATAALIESIERFDALQRPAAQRRRAADRQAGAERDAARERRRERLRREQAEAVRKMFVGMAEDPRVVIFKIADQLCTMRAVRDVADTLRASAGQGTSHAAGSTDQPGEETLVTDGDDARADTASTLAEGSAVAEQTWTLDECLAAAEETRTLYAPLAGRLGMGRMESELEDLAFAVLEPDEYRWLSEAVAEEKHQRSEYVTRVCGILREEMAKIGLHADVSGRVKHLYSIYRKVQRTGSRDISQLYDIVAFRVLVDTVAECYLALGHVHQLWKPKDGRIKDFIANPKPNGYQSLHTTVFCLDDRMVEVQIRTREQHQIAEYGLAMHWHYKEAGDAASAQAPDLQRWIKQVMEWQQDLGRAPNAPAATRPEPPRSDEVIYVFTPAGDPKELPAGATPLDFAYRVHSDVGNRTSGARVTTEDGRLVTRMVPLDYELKSGDTVEIITNKNAHPTRDWLQFARTKAARTHIARYLKAHERHIDQQIGREELDRDLRTQGLRGGIEDVRDDDLLWTARELTQPDIESLLVAIGTDKLRPSAVIAKLRERIPERFPPSPDARDGAEPASESTRPTEPAVPRGVDVAGVAGLYTRLASCCSPVPGDAVAGFITRGRGVVVHRADCATLAAMLAREPERAVTVSLSMLDDQQTYRVPIIVIANDRPGLLADVTGVIANLKINMVKVTTVTNPSKHSATITAILELNRAEQLDQVLRTLLGIKSVLSVERKQSRAASAPEPAANGNGRHARRKTP